MSDLLLIFISACLVNNLVLHHLIGVAPGVALARKIDVAAGLAVVTAVALTVATPISFVLDRALLQPLGLEYLQLIGFVLVIATLILSGTAALARLQPKWHDEYRHYVPLVMANSAVLGAALLNAGHDYDVGGSLFFGLGTAAGFGLVMVLVAALQERLLAADVPRPFRGTAALLMALAILSMAFAGFTGLAKL